MAASNADGRGWSIKNSVVLEINYIAYVGRRPSSSMGICQYNMRVQTTVYQEEP